jgi:hypothetical protein
LLAFTLAQNTWKAFIHNFYADDKKERQDFDWNSVFSPAERTKSGSSVAFTKNSTVELAGWQVSRPKSHTDQGFVTGTTVPWA